MGRNKSYKPHYRQAGMPPTNRKADMSKEYRKERREARRQLEAESRKDSREAATGLCMRTLETSAGPACINQNLSDNNPMSCANCVRFINYQGYKDG